MNLQLLEPAIATHTSGARQPRAWRFAWRVVGCFAMFLFATAAFALDPQKAITQFVHTAWTEKDGAPADIRSITQTKDGYLWLGTQTGLFSIDGTRFARFEPRAGEGLPTTHTRMLLATRDGSLWIVFFSGILRIGPRGDHEVVSRGGTLSMFEDEGGVLWRRSVLGP